MSPQRNSLVGQTLLSAVVTLAVAGTALADPCGMVPPVYVGDDVPIARIGIQKTYVFHRDGIETFVIRPGFQGKVEEFGMLIPMPAVPALRKVSDNVFPHVAAAVDPPEVVVYAQVFELARNRAFNAAPQASAAPGEGALADVVRALTQPVECRRGRVCGRRQFRAVDRGGHRRRPVGGGGVLFAGGAVAAGCVHPQPG